MGICDSRGAIHDFAGPYTVSVGQMAFGEPTRYLRLAPPAGGAWDDAVRVGDGVYAKRMHNLWCARRRGGGGRGVRACVPTPARKL